MSIKFEWDLKHAENILCLGKIVNGVYICIKWHYAYETGKQILSLAANI